MPDASLAATPPPADAGRKRRGVHPGWIAALAGVILAVLVVIAAQRGAQPSAPEAASTQAGSVEGPVTEQIALSDPGSAEVGGPAPRFTVTTTAGTSLDLPTGTPTVIFFMAGWCGTCLPEAAALEQIHQEYGEQVTILGVDADPSDPLDSLRAFIDTAGASYGYVRDGDGTLTRALQVQALDTTIITDSEGTIVYRDAIPTDEATLRLALAEAGLP